MEERNRRAHSHEKARSAMTAGPKAGEGQAKVGRRRASGRREELSRRS